MKSIKKNALFNVIKMVTSIISPMIILPYISRVLGANEMGVYNFSASIISYFILIGTLGIPTYAIREGVKYRENRIDIEKFASEVFSINIFSMVSSYIMLFFFVMMSNKLEQYLFILLMLSSEIFFSTFSKDWLLNIYEDFIFPALCSVISQIICIFLILVFVKTHNDVRIYVFIITSIKIMTNILYAFRVRKYTNVKFIFSSSLKKHIKPIFLLFSFSITSIIYVSSDTTILGFFRGEYWVGIYSGSVKLYTVIKSFILAVLTVLIPRFSMLAYKNKISFSEMLSKIFGILITIITPIVVGMFFESLPIINIVLGTEYVTGNICLKILSVASFFSFIGYLYIQCVLIPLKKDKIVLVTTAIGACVNIIFNILFIPFFGINAAAYTTLIAEVIVSTIVFYKSRRYISLNIDRRDLFSCIVGAIAIGSICILNGMIFNSEYIELIVSILESVIVYIFILLKFHNTILIELSKVLRRRK